jgi:GT2 family glycosyltransferase
MTEIDQIVVSASIVLYKTDENILRRTMDSFECCNLDVRFYLIDNSPSNVLERFATSSKIQYFHIPSNIGFGSAHNIAIQNALDSGSNYHFVINPDVYFEEDIISSMVAYMQTDLSIGMIMPKILNLDGTIQYLPKLLPSPMSILWRKIRIPQKKYSKFISHYELRYLEQDITYNAPILSGCFTLLCLKAVEEVGMYDDRFFMYFEDWDLSRRMHKKYKTIYYPKVSVYHGYESGANKSIRLFKIFIKSSFRYFNKWGWFFDEERDKINKTALAQFTK